MSNLDKQALIAKIKKQTASFDTVVLKEDEAKALLGELEAAEKRIAELEPSHSNLREAMAGIHNTVSGGGAYTPLAAILNASKRAYEESAAASGKGAY